jgi:hypothetical protein
MEPVINKVLRRQQELSEIPQKKLRVFCKGKATGVNNLSVNQLIDEIMCSEFGSLENRENGDTYATSFVLQIFSQPAPAAAPAILETTSSSSPLSDFPKVYFDWLVGSLQFCGESAPFYPGGLAQQNVIFQGPTQYGPWTDFSSVPGSATDRFRILAKTLDFEGLSDSPLGIRRLLMKLEGEGVLTHIRKDKSHTRVREICWPVEALQLQHLDYKNIRPAKFKYFNPDDSPDSDDAVMYDFDVVRRTEREVINPFFAFLYEDERCLALYEELEKGIAKTHVAGWVESPDWVRFFGSPIVFRQTMSAHKVPCWLMLARQAFWMWRHNSSIPNFLKNATKSEQLYTIEFLYAKHLLPPHVVKELSAPDEDEPDDSNYSEGPYSEDEFADNLSSASASSDEREITPLSEAEKQEQLEQKRDKKRAKIQKMMDSPVLRGLTEKEYNALLTSKAPNCYRP